MLAVEAATCAVAAHRQPGRVVMDDEIIRAANAKKGSPFLDTAQAAHYVGLSRRTLEKMRVAGGGPRFRKHGRYVRYHIDDLDDRSEEHTSELQSLMRISYAVFCLKKKKNNETSNNKTKTVYDYTVKTLMTSLTTMHYSETDT